MFVAIVALLSFTLHVACTCMVAYIAMQFTTMRSELSLYISYVHTLANYAVLHILYTYNATMHMYSRQYEAHHPPKAFACVVIVHFSQLALLSITLSDSHFSANYMVPFCCHIMSLSVFSMIPLLM